jgi:hypothetical protein
MRVKLRIAADIYQQKNMRLYIAICMSSYNVSSRLCHCFTVLTLEAVIHPLQDDEVVE